MPEMVTGRVVITRSNGTRGEPGEVTPPQNPPIAARRDDTRHPGEACSSTRPTGRDLGRPLRARLRERALRLMSRMRGRRDAQDDRERCADKPAAVKSRDSSLFEEGAKIRRVDPKASKRRIASIWLSPQSGPSESLSLPSRRSGGHPWEIPSAGASLLT